MSSAAQAVVQTLTLGAIYALVAVGFVVLFRATKVLSFAQGAFLVIGALIFNSLAGAGWNPWSAAFASIVITFVIGAFTYRIFFARIAGTEPFVTAMATIGLTTLYVAIAVMIWGATQITLPTSYISARQWSVGPFQVNVAEIAAVATAAVVFVLLVAGLQRTRFGLRMRAVADNTRLAGQAGVNTVLVSMTAWGIAAAAAAAAAICYLLSNVPDPDSLQDLGLLAFPAILLGGLDSITGALVGGLMIALIQSLTATYWSGDLQDVVAYIVLLVVLLLRPSGLFGRAEAQRL